MTMTPSGRDYRIDFWRGVALVTIFINHVPGNLLERVTHRNFGLSDSAELFVFLAGFSASLAYFGAYRTGDPLVVTGRVLQRTWTLYVSHIVLMVAAIAGFFAAAMLFRDVHWAEAYGLDILSTEPIRGFVGIATLGHQIGYFNILPLYVALFAMLPVIMALAARNLGLALAASLTLYVWSHVSGIRLPSYPSADAGWFFEPLRWQLLFTIGFVAGTLYRDGRPVPFHPLAFAAAVVVLVVGAVMAIGGLFPQPGMLSLPQFLWMDDKSGLSVPRLLHVLALVYVVAHAPYAVFDRMVAWFGPETPLVRIGRRSLPMFCLGSVLMVIGQIALRRHGADVMTGTAIVLAGLFVTVAAAYAMDWWRDRVATAATAAAARRKAAPSAAGTRVAA